MNQEVEIEYKNLLTKDEFEKLLTSFHIKQEDFITQENHYFDTAHFSLKAHGSALRIRKKQGKYTLTLKQPYQEGLLETHQSLSEQQATALLTGESLALIDGEIKNIIINYGINPNEVLFLGTLTTDRVELNDGENLLVLDHSYYLGQEDYELEYEVKNAIKGKQRFYELLDEYDIIERSTENKIKRFFNVKKQQ